MQVTETGTVIQDTATGEYWAGMGKWTKRPHLAQIYVDPHMADRARARFPDRDVVLKNADITIYD